MPVVNCPLTGTWHGPGGTCARRRASYRPVVLGAWVHPEPKAPGSRPSTRSLLPSASTARMVPFASARPGVNAETKQRRTVR
jgi:hypothetical protein